MEVIFFTCVSFMQKAQDGDTIHYILVQSSFIHLLNVVCLNVFYNIHLCGIRKYALVGC